MGYAGAADLQALGEQLEWLRNRLLELAHERNRFLRHMSHELKTPLAITRSSLENLESRPLDEEARRYLSRALEGLDRQGAMVRAMSEASRLEAGQKVQIGLPLFMEGRGCIDFFASGLQGLSQAAVAYENALAYAKDLLAARGANGVMTAVLLDKPGHRAAELDADFKVFDCPDRFVVGYGMDMAHAFRELPFVGHVVNPPGK